MLGVLVAQIGVYAQASGALGLPDHARAVGLSIDPTKHTLVMAVHPKCPCTRASLYELERIIAKSGDGLGIALCLYEPGFGDEDWYSESSGAIQERFPGADVIRDPDGVMAEKLGAVTSGSVVLYAPDGEPVFWGGITHSRGHSGDNLGSDLILSILRGDTGVTRSTKVYGCPITELGCEDPLGSCTDEDTDRDQRTEPNR